MTDWVTWPLPYAAGVHQLQALQAMAAGVHLDAEPVAAMPSLQCRAGGCNGRAGWVTDWMPVFTSCKPMPSHAAPVASRCRASAGQWPPVASRCKPCKPWPGQREGRCRCNAGGKPLPVQCQAMAHACQACNPVTDWMPMFTWCALPPVASRCRASAGHGRRCSPVAAGGKPLPGQREAVAAAMAGRAGACG